MSDQQKIYVFTHLLKRSARCLENKGMAESGKKRRVAGGWQITHFKIWLLLRRLASSPFSSGPTQLPFLWPFGTPEKHHTLTLYTFY